MKTLLSGQPSLSVQKKYKIWSTNFLANYCYREISKQCFSAKECWGPFEFQFWKCSCFPKCSSISVELSSLFWIQPALHCRHVTHCSPRRTNQPLRDSNLMKPWNATYMLMGIRIFEIQQLVLCAVTGQLLGAPVKLHTITSTCRKLGNGTNENLSVPELICVLHFGYAWGTVNSCTILIIWKVLRAWNCAVSCVNSQQLLQPNNGLLRLIRKRGRRKMASRTLRSPSREREGTVERLAKNSLCLTADVPSWLWFSSSSSSAKLCKSTILPTRGLLWKCLLCHALSKRSLCCWSFFLFFLFFFPNAASAAPASSCSVRFPNTLDLAYSHAKLWCQGQTTKHD